MLRACIIPAILLAVVTCLSPGATAAQIAVPADHPTIQAAIDAAADGDVVVVSPGRYPQHISFVGKAITLRSTDPDDDDVVAGTIIDGQDEHRCVSFVNGETDSSVLSGFTITNGHPTGDGEEDNDGGGIYCSESSPTIADNVIAGNTADRGGALFCRGGAPVVTNNVISMNSARAFGMLLFFSSPIITGNWMLDNRGGGIYCSVGPALIAGNTVHNSGGIAVSRYLRHETPVDAIIGNVISAGESGAVACYRSDALIIGNLISDRDAFWGAISCSESAPLVVGNVVAGTDDGAAIHVRDSNWYSSSCAFLCNNVLAKGKYGLRSAIACYESDALVVNCIIWNPGRQIYVARPPSQLTITGSLISPESTLAEEGCTITWGPGNIEGDPLFIDPGHWEETVDPDDPLAPVYTFIPGDYHLLPGSPCIDAGTNDVDNPDTEAIEELPETDMDGVPRIIDGDLDGVATVDVGAYEFLPGDTNYDGKVNILDLIFIRNYLGADPASIPAARHADLNADGTIDMLDLIAARNQMGVR